MVGTFRVVKTDAAVFYEFWAIEVEDGKAVFKMKHFNRGLAGWEEKNDVVRLVMTVKGEGKVVFANADDSLSLTYEGKGDELTGTLRRGKGDAAKLDAFRFHRQK